jgi:hypothetical protein
MDRRSLRGRDGIRIPESGTADLSFRLEWDSESGFSVVLAGVGIIGDATGMATPSFTITPTTIREVQPFTTEMLTTAAAAEDPARPVMQTTGPEVRPDAAMCTTVRGHRLGHLRETSTPHGATRSLRMGRPAHIRAPSAAMITEANREVTHRAEAPAFMAEAAGEAEDLTEEAVEDTVGAATTDAMFVLILDSRDCNGREVVCSQ